MVSGGVTAMILVTVMFVFIAAAAVVAFVWPIVEGWNAADAAKSPGTDATASKPETLEGVFVRQLLDREINGRRYLHAMELLAERDADRHPLSVPPER
jgi:hypothetical protein